MKSKSVLNIVSAFIMFMIAVIIFSGFCVPEQSKILNYKIVQNNNVIGWMKLEKKDSINAYRITLNSETKKRFVFLFTIIQAEQSLFENGILTHSYSYRKINNDIKENKHTDSKGSCYEIKKENSITQIKLSNITYNQLCLYFFEPVNISQLYSDSYEQNLKIEKKENQLYVIEFPDGNKNSYSYSNGICSKVKVEQSLFTIEFILSQ
ncbi:MAG: DUF6134 family protein [Parafilimonas sp.]